jgi:DNA-directed RNA polymerase specialized sigma54-like protein
MKLVPEQRPKQILVPIPSVAPPLASTGDAARSYAAEAPGTRRVSEELLETVKGLIDREDPATPMTDTEIVAELHRSHPQFEDVSRSTVALTRRELGIGPTSDR